MKLIILGNGFDLHHGLKTSFNNFKSYCKDNGNDEFIDKVDEIIKQYSENFKNSEDLDWSNIEEIFHKKYLKVNNSVSLDNQLIHLNNQIREINNNLARNSATQRVNDSQNRNVMANLKSLTEKKRDTISKINNVNSKYDLDEFEELTIEFTEKFNDYMVENIIPNISYIEKNPKIHKELNSDCHIITFNYTNVHEIYGRNKNALCIHGSIKDGGYPVIGFYHNINAKKNNEHNYRKKYSNRIFSKEVIYERMHGEELTPIVEKFLEPLKEAITEIVIIGYSIGESDDYINDLLFDLAKMHQKNDIFSNETVGELDVLKIKIYNHNKCFENGKSKLLATLSKKNRYKVAKITGTGIRPLEKPCVEFIEESY